MSRDTTVIQCRQPDAIDDPLSELAGGRTHASTTDPDARLYRKGADKEAKLSFIGHGLMENRSGLMVDACLTRADGHAERVAGLHMIEPHAKPLREIVGMTAIADHLSSAPGASSRPTCGIATISISVGPADESPARRRSGRDRLRGHAGPA